MKLLPASAHAAFIKSVPDALRPSWLLDTWTGSFGARNIQASASSAKTTLHLTRDGMSGSASVRGRVREWGIPVGEFIRETSLDISGSINIDHTYLSMLKVSQGTGFARAFNDHAFRRYAEAGVDTVSIHAALKVGGYAWARHGFELVADGATEAVRELQRARKVAALVDNALETRRITTQQYDSIRPFLVGADERITAGTITGVRQLAEHPLGRPILLGNHWSGVRQIAHAGHWWDDVAGPTTDALSGASLLQRGGDRGMTGLVARRASARLAAAFDPSTVGRMLEQRTHGEVTTAVARVELSGADDAITDIGSRYELHSTRGFHQFDVSHGALRGAKVRERGASTDAYMRTAFDQVWSDVDAHVTRRR